MIGKDIVDEFVDQVRAYLLQAFDQKVGSLRIGCHSLIAKDTGTELFYVAGMACAESVHWYIVNTLARHGRGRQLEVCRGSKDSDDKTCTVPVFCSQSIDWLELSECFRSNPLSRIHAGNCLRSAHGMEAWRHEPLRRADPRHQRLASLAAGLSEWPGWTAAPLRGNASTSRACVTRWRAARTAAAGSRFDSAE